MPSNLAEVEAASAILSRWRQVPDVGGWRSQGQLYSWDEATLRAKWDSAQALCAQVASTRLDFAGLAA
eukprot:1761322-Amphidinium_carterae.1